MNKQEELKRIEAKLRFRSYFSIPPMLLIGLALNAKYAPTKDVWITALQDSNINLMALVVGCVWVALQALWMLPLVLQKKKLDTTE